MNSQDEKMMYRLFLSAVEKQVIQKVGQQYTVELGKTLKNNSVELDSIMIRGKDVNIAPNIFLNAYFKEYVEGREIESIVDEIVKIYFDNLNRFDMESIGDCSYDFLKDRIFFKLINKNMNSKLLESLPHIEIGNLVLIFACLVEHSKDGIASIRIDNTLIKKWNIDTQTLMDNAKENTVRLFPPKVFELDNANVELLLSHRLGDAEIKDLLNNCTERSDEKANVNAEGNSGSADKADDNPSKSRISDNKSVLSWIPDNEQSQPRIPDNVQSLSRVPDNMLPMSHIPENNPSLLQIPDKMPSLFVLTNRDGVDGATCIVYKGLLERIRRRLGRGFYIIPSSVHEVIILPEIEGYSRDTLESMVKEVNSTVLSEMDILSENVYYYPDDSFAV